MSTCQTRQLRGSDLTHSLKTGKFSRHEIFYRDSDLKLRSNMYNTGDLCQWNPNGTLHILGRIDDQVKVKGFRVELDGVTACIKSCPSVQSTTALLINNEIHAFITPATALSPLSKPISRPSSLTTPCQHTTTNWKVCL